MAAPAWWIARQATTQCQVFGDQMATRSPGSHAERDQRGRRPVYLVTQGGGREGAVVGDQRVVVGELARETIQRRGNGAGIVPRKREVPPGHRRS